MILQYRSSIHRLCIIFLCLTLSVSSYSQLNSGNFTQFTEKDGLPGVQVNDLLIDRLGYIWAGTVNGLARYDGYTFKRFYFNPNDTNTIRGLIVYSMFEDRKGQIWVSTSPGYLNVYDPVTQKFREYKFSSQVPRPEALEINIHDICEDDNGRMYFGVDTYYGDTISSALLYKNENEETINLFPIPADLHVQNVYRLKKDNNGNVWVLSRSGIFKIDKQGKLSRFSLMDSELTMKNEYAGDVNFDKNGHMWLLTYGLKLYDIDLATSAYRTWFSKELYRTNDFYYVPRRIVFDKDENIWMGTNGGLQFFNRKTGKFSMFTSGAKIDLERTTMIELGFDSFGTLWVATGAMGLLKYEEKTLLRSYSFGNKDKYTLTSGWANTIYEASDGKVWISTGGSDQNSGINILDPVTG
ncbi:MAG TPA: two-component regulator propeller domain-containing protein, partial [Chitinophagaceae bacterium]|nr:two-component regulator propeller domain-containing protein [Chitinophagaceae bacterium]